MVRWQGINRRSLERGVETDEKKSFLCVRACALKLKNPLNSNKVKNDSANIFHAERNLTRTKKKYSLFSLSHSHLAHQLCGFVWRYGQWPLEE